MNIVHPTLFYGYDRLEFRSELIEDASPYIIALHDLIARSLWLIGITAAVYATIITFAYASRPVFIRWRAVKVRPHVKRLLPPERMHFVKGGAEAAVK